MLITNTPTDQTLICHLFLLRLSVQRGTKPKKVLHVSLTSVSIAMIIQLCCMHGITQMAHHLCVCMCSWWVFVTILFMLIVCTLIHVCKCFASWMAVFFGEWLLLNGFYELACWVKCVYVCQTDIVTMWVNKFNFKFDSILLLVC